VLVGGRLEFFQNFNWKIKIIDFHLFQFYLAITLKKTCQKKLKFQIKNSIHIGNLHMTKFYQL
jgi:hypothetical protein